MAQNISMFYLYTMQRKWKRGPTGQYSTFLPHRPLLCESGPGYLTVKFYRVFWSFNYLVKKLWLMDTYRFLSDLYFFRIYWVHLIHFYLRCIFCKTTISLSLPNCHKFTVFLMSIRQKFEEHQQESKQLQ